MANYLNIEKALFNAYEALVLGLPTSYPAAELSDEEKPDDLWIALHNLRGETSPVTLGDQGENDNPGVFQIDINYPRTKGTGALLALADQIIAAFEAGTTLTYNGQEVRITQTSLGPGRYMGGYYRISVSIYYYARTPR